MFTDIPFCSPPPMIPIQPWRSHVVNAQDSFPVLNHRPKKEPNPCCAVGSSIYILHITSFLVAVYQRKQFANLLPVRCANLQQQIHNFHSGNGKSQVSAVWLIEAAASSAFEKWHSKIFPSYVPEELHRAILSTLFQYRCKEIAYLVIRITPRVSQNSFKLVSKSPD